MFFTTGAESARSGRACCRTGWISSALENPKRVTYAAEARRKFFSIFGISECQACLLPDVNFGTLSRLSKCVHKITMGVRYRKSPSPSDEVEPTSSGPYCHHHDYKEGDEELHGFDAHLT